jgi:hypothetical protein
MANEFKLLVDELKYKLTVAFNRINKLELELQNKTSHIHSLEERLGLNVSMSIEEGKKSNGKS